MSSKPTLYALLVGINDYPLDSALEGCINDVNLMKQYLLSQTDAFHVNESTVKTLTDYQASKTSVVENFKNHFKNATAEDTVLFYFSGHGCQEIADTTVWRQERDGKLECVVCYIIPGSQSSPLLADKELRYLIANLYSTNKPEIITIFDCCHSGDNTRESWVMQGVDTNDIETYKAVRRLVDPLPQRPWNDFIFHKEITSEEATNHFPAGTHVQIAACQDKQLATEAYHPKLAQTNGVFTRNLVRILKETNGNIAYYDLKTRIKNFTKFAYNQIPQLYYNGLDKHYQYRGFLGKEVNQKVPFQGELIQHEEDQWILSLGALNGISPALKHLDLTIPDIGKVKADIVEIEPDVTIVSFQESLLGKLRNSQEPSITCFVHSFLSEPMTLFIMDDEGVESEVAALTQKIKKEIKNIKIVEKEMQANYILQIIDGEYRLFLGNDTYQLRPITKVIVRYEEDKKGLFKDNAEADQTLLSYLTQMARWTYIKELENQNLEDHPFRNKPPLEISVQRASSKEHYHPVQANGSTYTLAYYKKKISTGRYIGTFKLKVKNTYEHPVYFTMVALNGNFTAFTRLSRKEKNVYEIQPNETIQVTQGDFEDMPFIREYNWPEATTYFKFIVSTEQNIDYDFLSITDGLPEPETVNKPRTKGEFDPTPKHTSATLKNVVFRDDEEDESEKGWTTQNYTFKFPNPDYNRITQKDLQDLIDHEIVGEYAIRLYVEKNGLQIIPPSPKERAEEANRAGEETPTEEIYTLKEEINPGTKNFIWNAKLRIANKVAKYLRHRRFNRQFKRYPERAFMISEGDSWFQHPLVKEIIDQLMKYYNIYSLGEAGDEIRNYFMKGKFHQALEDVQKKYHQTPRILLLSGGGNDILGKQLVDFVHPKAEIKDQTNPADYFTTKFDHEIDTIMEIYADIFETTKDKIPNIDIITHGYDYILAAKRKTSWVNKYLIQQGYDTEEERKMLIKYLIDTFNLRLETLANQSQYQPYVHYINGRGEVQQYQWYDEIHPNKEGFQQIVLKFRKKIREVLSNG